MTFYWHSPEGEAAYKKIGLQYQMTVQDEKHTQFKTQTRKSPDDITQNIITKMIRIQSSFVNPKDNPQINDKEVLAGEKLREYITYDLVEKRVDPLGNERTFARLNLGRHQVPIPRYQMRKDAEGYEERFTAGIADIRTGYSILFTPKNADKLHKTGCISDDPKEIAKAQTKREEAALAAKAVIGIRSANEQTHYYVQKEGEQRKYTCRSYEDWRDGSFIDLISFGHANVTKDEWTRKKAVDEVAAAQRMGIDTNIEDKINEAANRNKASETVYK